MTFKKRIVWFFKRHPILYFIRFKLLSKSIPFEQLKDACYNDSNQIQDIPKYFLEVNKKIFNSEKEYTDFDKMKKIASWLSEKIRGGRGLSLSSEQVLKQMLNNDGGVCSDQAQVFNNFCVINDLMVREWGNTHYPFSPKYGGHSFNEVFCKELDKWVMVDVAHCVAFLDAVSKPLSVLEYYKPNRDLSQIHFKSFSNHLKLDSKLLNIIYKNKNLIPFYIAGYNNKVYDWYLNKFHKYQPVFMIHFLVYLRGKSYHYLFPYQNVKEVFVLKDFLSSKS